MVLIKWCQYHSHMALTLTCIQLLQKLTEFAVLRSDCLVIRPVGKIIWIDDGKVINRSGLVEMEYRGDL